MLGATLGPFGRSERAVRVDRVKVMGRRVFISVMTVGLLAAPLALEAQQARMSRVGVLIIGSSEPIRQSLRALGYVDGQNITIDARDTEGKPDRLDEFASELARLKVDVIVANYPAAVFSARRATTTIPIVMVNTPDPVGLGLVPASRVRAGISPA